MATAPSFSDLYDRGRAELVLRRPDLFCEPGDVTDMLLAAAAAGGDFAVGYAARRFAELFLDTASGVDLRALGDDRYGIVAFAAAKAQVTIAFNRVSAGVGAGSIVAGSVVATAYDSLGNTVEFETLALVSFGPADLSKTVAAQAKVAGAAGNVAGATITRLVSTLFDPTLTVTNALRAAGGAEAESDEAYRERVRTFPSTIRRGTLAALEYGARQIAGVVSAKVSEGPTGLVTVYIADATGNSNAALEALVTTELENWRAAGTVVTVGGATPVTLNLFFKIKAKPGFDVTASLTVIQDAVGGRMGKLTMGETLYLDELKAAVIAIDPDRIQRVTFYTDATFVTPAADATPGASQILKVGTVTVAAE
jgi:uncharacterized phage protein gp47/JayE